MITILMAIYNGSEFFEESFDSILSQTYNEWELIIGINGHPYDSDVYKHIENIVKQRDCKNTIKIIQLPLEIKGKSNTLNEMIKISNCDYIALLDVDDIWFPDKLEKQIPFIQQGYDIVGTKCVYFGELNGIVPDIPIGDFSNFNFLSVNPVINSSFVGKKELCHWNDYGIKDYGIEDYDLWLSLWKNNCSFYNCPEILIKHRIHKSSAFNSKNNSLRIQELIKKYSKSY